MGEGKINEGGRKKIALIEGENEKRDERRIEGI